MTLYLYLIFSNLRVVQTALRVYCAWKQLTLDTPSDSDSEVL